MLATKVDFETLLDDSVAFFGIAAESPAFGLRRWRATGCAGVLQASWCFAIDEDILPVPEGCHMPHSPGSVHIRDTSALIVSVYGRD